LFDKDNDGVWDFIKTFNRIEKYSNTFKNSILSKEVLTNYISNGLRYDKDRIDNQEPRRINQRIDPEWVNECKHHAKNFKEINLFGLELPHLLKAKLYKLTDDEKTMLLDFYLMRKNQDDDLNTMRKEILI
jgi:hypothetical protein